MVLRLEWMEEAAETAEDNCLSLSLYNSILAIDSTGQGRSRHLGVLIGHFSQE
jgi:hypothetical protein